MTESAYLLVVAPHPDDPEFGIAGTVARWIREGKSVVYVICTSGDKGSSDPAMMPEKLTKMREKEQRSAARLLGVKKVVFLHFPDQGLEDTPEFRKEIVRQIRIFKPEVVATADPYRRYLWHRDHRIAGQVTLDAVYPYARDFLAYPDLWEQGYQPHKVKEVLCWGTENPNYRIDITDTFDTKLAALRCHKSQIGEAPEVEKWVRQRAKDMAEGEKYKLAEAFHREEIRW